MHSIKVLSHSGSRGARKWNVCG